VLLKKIFLFYFLITLKVITMPQFDMVDYVLMVIIAVLAFCCYQCYNKEKYAPLAYFTVSDPKYAVDSQNVMSAPIVYKQPDEGAGQSVRPVDINGQMRSQDEGAGQSVRPVDVNGQMKSHNVDSKMKGPVSPIFDDQDKKEGFQYPLESDIKVLVPPHLKGGFVDPLSNPQMGYLPGGLEYGVSVPAIGNLSASVTDKSGPGALNVWNSVL
jgi:hypothetical protein